MDNVGCLQVFSTQVSGSIVQIANRINKNLKNLMDDCKKIKTTLSGKKKEA